MAVASSAPHPNSSIESPPSWHATLAAEQRIDPSHANARLVSDDGRSARNRRRREAHRNGQRNTRTTLRNGHLLNSPADAERRGQDPSRICIRSCQKRSLPTADDGVRKFFPFARHRPRGEVGSDRRTRFRVGCSEICAAHRPAARFSKRREAHGARGNRRAIRCARAAQARGALAAARSTSARPNSKADRAATRSSTNSDGDATIRSFDVTQTRRSAN